MAVKKCEALTNYLHVGFFYGRFLKSKLQITNFSKQHKQTVKQFIQAAPRY